MSTITGTGGKTMTASQDITAQLAIHDTAINGLSGRMTGVEQGLKTLQGEVHHGFASVTANVNSQLGQVQTSMNALGSKLDKIDNRPQFDFYKTVRTVQSLAVLFVMVCAGIIWITRAQFDQTIAEVKELKDKMQWVGRVEPASDVRRK